MEKEKMDVFLSKAVKKFEPGVTKKMIDSIPNQSEYLKIMVEGVSFDPVGTRLAMIGKILEYNEKKKTYVVCITVGVANANPCIVVVYVGEDAIIADAYAREGLIKQHTAKKAIKKLKENIEQAI
ncbi:MAG: hypothetical protein IKS56_03300 [Lachnospiraceae bacterium]|nr:hypothetical protein [Lachnospiraceae bacterium]